MNFLKLLPCRQLLKSSMVKKKRITKIDPILNQTIFLFSGTHISIGNPGGENAELFRNRKGFFSINTQVVVDASMKIVDIVARRVF